MVSFDTTRLVTEMATRYGIRLNEDDPALAMVGLNQLALEEAVRGVCDQLRARVAEFEASAQKVETRAGTILAQQVRESAAEIRREIQGDIHVASLRSRELLNRIHEAHRRPVLMRWTAIGILIAFLLFCCGIWVGRMTALGWARAGF